MKAIVYCSNAGHTKEYAEILRNRLVLPAYELTEAEKILPKNTEILYLGWLMAGNVKGYKKAIRSFSIKAVCGVGMAKTGSQIEDIRKSNSISDETPVFSLQGGFEMEKLHGIYKSMMKCMCAAMKKKYSQGQEISADTVEMLEMMNSGKNLVDDRNLNEITQWYEKSFT